MNPDFYTIWHILPSYLKWRPLCSNNSTYRTLFSLFQDCFQTTLCPYWSLCLPSSSQAAPLSYSPCFPNIQNPILSPIFLEAFVFWSIVSLPTLGAFRLLSSFNILLYVPFKIHSGFTFLELSTNRLCFHFVSGFQRHGYHLALIFVQKAFALLLKSSTLTFSPLATILWPFNRPIYSFK